MRLPFLAWFAAISSILAYSLRNSVLGRHSLRWSPVVYRTLPQTSKSVVAMSNKRSSEDSTGSSPKKSKKTPELANDGADVEGPPGAPSGFHVSRARLLTPRHNSFPPGECVVLWMSRDQRVNDNQAFWYAQSIAQQNNVPLRVVFNLVPRFLEATLRQYGFMIKGLQEVETTLRGLDIPFHLLMGDPTVNVPQFVQEKRAIALICDFSPLRVSSNWVNTVASTLNSSMHTPMLQVDAHNIVPCWVASPKLEYSAKTFRGKVTPKIPEYLQEVPAPSVNPAGYMDTPPVDWEQALASLEINREVLEVDWIKPGPTSALTMLQDFIDNRLKNYGDKRNDPNVHVASNLSPYFHFGHISSARCLITLKQQRKNGSSVDSFVEESVVRRELTDNFCYYNQAHYDSLQGCYPWAQETLRTHTTDPRANTYTRDQLEAGRTHDDLWNAAQLQMVKEGKMHGFLRMYWAKKILVSFYVP